MNVQLLARHCRIFCLRIEEQNSTGKEHTTRGTTDAEKTNARLSSGIFPIAYIFHIFFNRIAVKKGCKTRVRAGDVAKERDQNH